MSNSSTTIPSSFEQRRQLFLTACAQINLNQQGYDGRKLAQQIDEQCERFGFEHDTDMFLEGLYVTGKNLPQKLKNTGPALVGAVERVKSQEPQRYRIR